MIEINIDFTSEFSTTDNNLHTIEDTRKIQEIMDTIERIGIDVEYVTGMESAC